MIHIMKKLTIASLPRFGGAVFWLPTLRIIGLVSIMKQAWRLG